MPEKPDDWDGEEVPGKARLAEVLLKEVMELAKDDEIGGEFRELWWTIGPYDVVIVVDVPDHQALAAFSLTLAKKFQAQTTTMMALSTEEMHGPIKICYIKDGL
jgi:uncharacterized protein with GYD domain